MKRRRKVLGLIKLVLYVKEPSTLSKRHQNTFQLAEVTRSLDSLP